MHCAGECVSKVRQSRFNLIAKNGSTTTTLATFVVISLSIVLFSGCSSKTCYRPPATPQNNSPQYLKHFSQRGFASWYGHPFHGKTTANGERYDMYSLTAAHRFLPFNSQVLVTNLENQKQVVVRINDRGPFVQRRIIDLSYKAAQRLDMITSGVVPVQIRTSYSPFKQQKNHYIQVGSFLSKTKADQLLKELRNSGYTGSRIQKACLRKRVFWRVQAGIFPDYQAARNDLPHFKKKSPACFIIVED
jgi:rare lipoprotein A